MKNYSRKEFIKLSTAAGAGFLLIGCGDDGPKSETITNTSQSDTIKQKAISASGTFEKIDKNDSRYDALRRGFNTRIDKRPQLIALCTNTEEVAAAIKYAREHKLPVAIKSGGHSMEGFSCNDDGMVINLSQMNSVELLEDGKIKAGPGCTLSKLYDHLFPHGRLLPAGSCASVGLGGLALGGGYGIFARKYGFTCDHLLEATMVDGNGNIHNTKDEPELLWALRGGNTGSFGVVTEMVLQTHEAPQLLQAHYFKARQLNAERATSILQTWMELAVQLPASCFSGYVLNRGTLNILVTNFETSNTVLPELLNKLAAVTDTFHSSKVSPLQKMVKNYYGSKTPVYFRNSSAGLFNSFNDVVQYITKVFEKIVATPGMIYQVNTLGGKVRDEAFAKASSYPHRNFEFVSELQAYSTNPSQHQNTAAVTSEILKLAAGHGTLTQYVNYCSLEFADWETAYYGDNYARLQEFKRKYDPDNVIRHPQSIKL